MKNLVFALLLLPVLLTGCSSSFGYNNIDWLLYWYLDDYVELDKQQKKLFDVKVKAWHEWHRKKELVRYRQQLVELKEKLNAGPINAEQWLDEFARGRSHWTRLRDKIVPGLAQLAPQLTDEQVEGLFEQLEKDNKKREKERAETTLEERQEKQLKGLKSDVKDYVGRLTKQQEHIISEYSPRFKSSFDYWLDYRRAIQAHTRELMMNRKQIDFSLRLTEAMINSDDFKTAEYIDVTKHNNRVYAEMLAEINQTLSDKQMRRLNKEIDSLIDDLEDLIND